jgi:hypothetical protein
VPQPISGVANSANILAACNAAGMQTPCDYGALPRSPRGVAFCDVLLLQVPGPTANASTLASFSFRTILIILISRINCSPTSTFMMLMQMAAGLCKTGQAVTDGPTRVTSMARRCASRKEAHSRTNALRSLNPTIPTAPFGAAINRIKHFTAPALSTRVRDGVLLQTMVVSGFK